MDRALVLWQALLTNPWADLGLVIFVSIVAMSDFYRRFQKSIGQAPRLAALSPDAEGAETTPDISVIIPAYNEAVNIEGCMRAVLANDLPEGCELQLIVADDESTDDTRAIALKVAQDDRRVLVITVPTRVPRTKPGGVKTGPVTALCKR